MSYRGYVILILLFLASIVAAEETSRENSSVQAMNAYEKSYDVLMENVVNIKTPGYKALENVFIADDNGEITTRKVTRFSKGAFEETGRKLDVAIEGDGFFVLQGPNGLIYTRDGRFEIDAQYRLVSMSGKFPVLSTSGLVFLPPQGTGGYDVVITPYGNIMQGDLFVGGLMVVTFENLAVLNRINGCFFNVPEQKVQSAEVEDNVAGIVEANPKLKVGFLEASNVDLSNQLIELPLTSRKYDANSKALQIIKRSASTAREMGRPQ